MMKQKWSVQEMITTGMLAAVAGVLMSFEFSVPMMPPFYKVDFSDVPSIIALFTMGASAAVCVEVIKLVIKVIMVGTNSMYVGEVANILGIFLFVLPVWVIYKKGGRTAKAAIVALIASLPIRITFSCFLNACITLPLYAKAMGLSLTDVVRSVAAVNPMIQDLPTFLVMATIPFNLLKITLNYIAGYTLFERLKAFGLARKVV